MSNGFSVCLPAPRHPFKLLVPKEVSARVQRDLPLLQSFVLDEYSVGMVHKPRFGMTVASSCFYFTRKMEMNEEVDRPLSRYILGCCLTAGHNASQPWPPTIWNQVQIGGGGSEF